MIPKAIVKKDEKIIVVRIIQFKCILKYILTFHTSAFFHEITLFAYALDVSFTELLAIRIGWATSIITKVF